MTSPQTPAGWYPDPEGSGQQRYWDGQQWTQHYSAPAGAPAPAAGAPGGFAPARPAAPVGPAPQLWWGVPAVLLLLLIGCVGTWVSSDVEIFGQTQSNSDGGMEKDGPFVLTLGIIALVLLVLWRAQRRAWQAWVAAGVAGLATVICIADVIDVGSLEETALGEVSVGWGLWLALISSIALTILSIVLALQSRRATA